MSQPPNNFPLQSFPNSKDPNAFPPDLQSKLLMSLQNQQGMQNFPKQSRPGFPYPDIAELNAFQQASKKVKPDPSPFNMFPNPGMGLPPFGNMNPGGNPQLELLMQKEGLTMPEQWNPRMENPLMQQQQRQGGQRQGNPNFPNLDQNPNNPLAFMPELGFMDAGQDPRALAALKQGELLGMPNELREQALKNMLLMQSLQGGGGDPLTNRILQAQLLQQQQQQQLQAQLLKNAMLSGGGPGANPLMALQYMEMQKRLQGDPFMQGGFPPQRGGPGNDLMRQNLLLQDMMQQQRQMEGAGLGRNVKAEEMPRFEGLKEEAQMNPRMMMEEAERQRRKGEEIDSIARNIKQEGMGRERENKLLEQQQQQQQMLAKRDLEEKLAARRMEEMMKMQAMEGLNRGVKIEKEQPKMPMQQQAYQGFKANLGDAMKAENIKKEQMVKQSMKPVKEEPPMMKNNGMQAVNNMPKRGAPQQLPPQQQMDRMKPVKQQKPPVREPEPKKPTKVVQNARMKFEDAYEDEEEDDDGEVIRPIASRSQRYTQRNGSQGPPQQVKIPQIPMNMNVKIEKKVPKEPKKPREIGILQPKEDVAARTSIKYLIEVSLPGQPMSTAYKRTPIGCEYQAILVNNFDLNLEGANEELRRKKPLVPKSHPEEIGATFFAFPQGLDPMSMEGKEPKEIKVGASHQADLSKFKFEGDIHGEVHKHPIKLVASPGKTGQQDTRMAE